MSTQYFLPGNDDERHTWGLNFSAKLPLYAAKYGISKEEVVAVEAGLAWFGAILAYQKAFVTFGNNITAYKLALRNGLAKGATLSPLSIPAPKLPDGEPAPGVFELVTSIAGRIKNTRGYAEADGKDLGIIGAEIVPPDYNTLTPALKVTKGNGGHPELKWGKQQMPQLEICVDRGEGKGWETVVTSNQAHFLDQHPLPAAGSSAVWRYKAIYKLKDVQTGQWCEPVSISVMG